MGASMSQYEAPREPLPDDQDEVAEGPPYAVGRQARLSDDRSSSHLAAVTAFASFAMFLLLFLFVYIVLLHSQLSATRQSVIDFDAWKTSTDQWKQTVEDRQARTDIIQDTLSDWHDRSEEQWKVHIFLQPTSIPSNCLSFNGSAIPAWALKDQRFWGFMGPHNLSDDLSMPNYRKALLRIDDDLPGLSGSDFLPDTPPKHSHRIGNSTRYPCSHRLPSFDTFVGTKHADTHFIVASSPNCFGYTSSGQEFTDAEGSDQVEHRPRSTGIVLAVCRGA